LWEEETAASPAQNGMVCHSTRHFGPTRRVPVLFLVGAATGWQSSHALTLTDQDEAARRFTRKAELWLCQ
jgi:hypothetical protein